MRRTEPPGHPRPGPLSRSASLVCTAGRRPVLAAALAAALLASAACTAPDDDAPTAPAEQGAIVAVPADGLERFDTADLRGAGLDPSWWPAAELDRRERLRRAGVQTPPAPRPPPARPRIARPTPAPDEPITPRALRADPPLPVPGAGDGPAALRVQILLDQTGFSPGALDGRWGENTEKAVYWFQHAHGITPTGSVDRSTFRRLVDRASDPEPLARYTVTAADVDGPFRDIPPGIYAKAGLDCLCYESALELLAERFHTVPELLRRLNPRVDFAALTAGTTLRVPNVLGRNRHRPGHRIDRILISRDGFYTHALDEHGRILLHFPSTLGSQYSPSPTGELRVTAVVHRPRFHFTPLLFRDVPNVQPDTVLPPGPNSPIGVVWLELSRPHYGIHGTAAPATIGYVSSHGCIRLTNWDALLLAHLVEPRIPVHFR